MKKLTLKFCYLFSIIFTISCSNDKQDVVSPENMQHRNSNTLPKELTHESIKEIAEAHNYYLNIIHSTYGDIHQYNPTQVDDFYVEFLDSMGVLNNANKKNLKIFLQNIRSVDNIRDLIIKDTEDQYYQNIQNVLSSSNDLEELNDSLNNIIENVIKDNREIYKTPIIAYAETIKKSAYYWAPVTIGGSGKGDLILKNGDNYDSRSWAKAADTDGKALASGFIGLAAYGAWGVLFGPAGFALIAADVVFVVVGAAISSAMFP